MRHVGRVALALGIAWPFSSSCLRPRLEAVQDKVAFSCSGAPHPNGVLPNAEQPSLTLRDASSRRYNVRAHATSVAVFASELQADLGALVSADEDAGRRRLSMFLENVDLLTALDAVEQASDVISISGTSGSLVFVPSYRASDFSSARIQVDGTGSHSLAKQIASAWCTFYATPDGVASASNSVILATDHDEAIVSLRSFANWAQAASRRYGPPHSCRSKTILQDATLSAPAEIVVRRCLSNDDRKSPCVSVYARNAPVGLCLARIAEFFGESIIIESDVADFPISVASEGEYVDDVITKISEMAGARWRTVRLRGAQARLVTNAGTPVLTEVTLDRGDRTALADAFCEQFASRSGAASVIGSSVVVLDDRSRAVRFREFVLNLAQGP